MSDFIPAAIGLAVMAMIGFVAGRQSLWQRVVDAEERAQRKDEMVKLGWSVRDSVRDVLAMSSCIGDEFSYQQTARVSIDGGKAVKMTFEVEA